MSPDPFDRLKRLRGYDGLVEAFQEDAGPDNKIDGNQIIAGLSPKAISQGSLDGLRSLAPSIDQVQTGLDALGMTEGPQGTLADIGSAGIDFYNGRPISGGALAGASLPVVGGIFAWWKAARKADNAVDAGTDLKKLKDQAGAAFGAPNVAGAGRAVDAANSIAAKGTSVIGPRATYRQFAKDIDAKFLDVTDDAWTWAKNEEFLAGIVQRGDDVVFAGKFNPARLDPNSALAKEIKYLIDHGYQWTDDFSKLIKP